MIVFDSSERLVGLLEAVCQSSRNRARRFPFVLRACAAISPTTPLTPPGLRAFGEVPPRPTSKRFQDSVFFASMMGKQLLSHRIPRRPQRKWVEKPLCRWSPLPPLAGREASSIDSSSSLRAQNPPQSEATLAPASNHPQNTHNSYPVDPNLCYPVNKFNSTRFLLENASATEIPSSGWLLPLGGKRRQIADSVH